MQTSLLLLVLGMIVIGAIAQRVAGLGFAMVVSPFLIVLLGPHEGVYLVNICGVASSLLIMPRVFRDIDWAMFRWLAAFSLIGSVAGSLAAMRIAAGPLSVVVGSVVLAALALSVVLVRTSFTARGNVPKAAAGLLSGATNAIAGVGGPAVSAYAVLARWPQRSFAATLQPFFVLTGTVTVAVKSVAAPGQLPQLPLWAWLGIVACIWGGVLIGERVQRRVHDAHARFFVLCVAFIGALTALFNGLAGL